MLGAATPELERLEALSEAVVGRTQEAEEMLRGFPVATGTVLG